MNEFEKWDKEFRTQNLNTFNGNIKGLLWLKVRAVSRSKQMSQFLLENKIKLSSNTLSKQSVELFNVLLTVPDAMKKLDIYLKSRNNELYAAMNVDEAKLKDDLYKVKYYAWGGDKNNSFDKHLVSKYVKSICDYDSLEGKQGEIAENAWNYVQTSWYNNWTSYLIETLFKRHERVISAVGEIKSVDFFIDDYPIDLKVTYFPNQFMDLKLKEKLGCGELSWLKREAKKLGVKVNSSLDRSQQKYMLFEKLSEQGRVGIIEELNKNRKEIVEEAKTDNMELLQWLYSNQGEMRFGAENRLFVILVDSTDMSQSWKMKRAFSLIEPKVESYLNLFTKDTLKEVCFTFNKSSYKSLADTIFIIK